MALQPVFLVCLSLYSITYNNVMIVSAYPDYLLSRSNCWTELSTDEVIMNFPVVSVAESDDPMMHIEFNNDNNSIGVRTTNPKTDKDYQYVIDVIEGDCSFPKGGCEGNKRIGGRSKDLADIIIQGNCKLQAGWAAGHEAVRLTPVVDIGSTGDSEASTSSEEMEPGDEAGQEGTKQKELADDKKDVDDGSTSKKDDDVTSRIETKKRKFADEDILHDAVYEDPAEHERQRLSDASNEKITDRRKQWRDSLQKKTRDAKDLRKMYHHHSDDKQALKRHYQKNLFLYTIGFEGVGMSWSAYWRGAAVMLLTPCFVVFLCLKITERSNKKRRDL